MHSFSVLALATFSNQTIQKTEATDVLPPDIFQAFPDPSITTAAPLAHLIVSTVLIPLSLPFHALTHISKRPGRIPLSPWIGKPIAILISGIALVFLCIASASLTHSIDKFLSELTQYLDATIEGINGPLVVTGDISRGKAFMILICAATALTAITFLAYTLEYMILHQDSYRQKKITAYNSNLRVLPEEDHDFPPEYKSQNEETTQEVGEVGPETIALQEINVRDSEEAPVSPISVRSRTGSRGSGRDQCPCSSCFAG